MPIPLRPTAAALACLSWLASYGSTVAQAPAPPTATTPATPATPAQAAAIAEFRPHAERACRAHYLRPDDSRSCIQRVLDAALPLSLENAERPTPTTAPPVEGRGTTVAPDGRE
jgi:hypothetical protein